MTRLTDSVLGFIVFTFAGVCFTGFDSMLVSNPAPLSQPFKLRAKEFSFKYCIGSILTKLFLKQALLIYSHVHITNHTHTLSVPVPVPIYVQ